MSSSLLLSRMWQLPHGIILLLLSAAITLCLAGSFIFVLSKGRGKKHIIGLACFFLGLSTLYSVIIPPFHAPDEQRHYLFMMQTMGRESDATAVKNWARNGYFEEIKHNPKVNYGYLFERHLLPWDLEPDTFVAVDMKSRSPLTIWFYKTFKPVISPLSIEYCLLTMRIINGITVTLFYTIALVALWKCRIDSTLKETNRIHPLVTGSSVLLYIPALSFFSMHISNYPFLISGGILGGAIALMILFFGWRPLWLGGLFGFTIFWLMSSGRVGYVFACFVMLLVAIGPFFKHLQKVTCKESRKSAFVLSAKFWLIVICGWGLAWLLLGRPELALIAPSLQAALTGFLGRIAQKEWLLLFVPVFFFFLETVCNTLPSFRCGRRAAKAIAFLGLLFFSLGALGLLFGNELHLANIEGVPKGLVTVYVRDVLLAFWGSQGLALPDRYLVKYFWVGFGWLENMPRDIVIMSLGLPIFIGNVHIWWRAFRSASLPMACRLSAWFVVCVAYLVALAIGAWNLGINLHGRYLILLYLIYLPVGFSGFYTLTARIISLSSQRIRTLKHMSRLRIDNTLVVSTVMMASCLIIHFFSAWNLLHRYIR